MKKLLKIINWMFAIALIISFTTMLIAIIYTFVDLSRYPFNISSKNHIEYFIKSFDWCKDIIGSVFVVLSVFYAFQTFKIHNENRLFNNYIAPRGEKINTNLKKIETQNKQLYNFISRNHGEIIKKIICKEEDNNNTINNKEKLIFYFDKYAKKQINKFEHSGYYGNECKGNCSICPNFNKKPTYNTNQFERFRLFAFDLFCISVEYSDFEKDMKEIYEKNCSISHS
jgi:hypothetical protein